MRAETCALDETDLEFQREWCRLQDTTSAGNAGDGSLLSDDEVTRCRPRDAPKTRLQQRGNGRVTKFHQTFAVSHRTAWHD